MIQSYSFLYSIGFHTRFFFERAPGKPKPFGFSRSEKLRSTVGELFFAPGKQRDRGHIKYDKGAVRRRGEKDALTADGLWFTGCSGAKKKLTKRNAVKEMRRGGFLKKAPS